MSKFIIAPITIQQIIVFLSLYDTCNFTQTAYELNMTQPGISKSLVSLESILGFKLFIRDKHNVAPTLTGEILYNNWKNVPPLLNQGVKLASDANDNDNQILGIGISETVLETEFLMPYTKLFSSVSKNYKLSVHERDYITLRKLLSNGGLDLIILPDFSKDSIDKQLYDYKYIALNKAQVYLSKNNRFFSRDFLSIEDIKDCPLIILDRGIDSGPYNAIKTFYSMHGYDLKVECYYSSHFQIYTTLKTSDSIFITDNYWGYNMNTDEIKKIPLSEFENGLICVWRKNNTKSILKKFLHAVDSVMSVSDD